MCGRVADYISKAPLEVKCIFFFKEAVLMTPAAIREQFFSVLNDTEKNISAFVKNPGSDMSRHRACSFSDTVNATLCFGMNRTNTELLNFFGLTRKTVPSKSAFSQQRKKLNSGLFPHLLHSFNNAIPMTKTYNGFHLAAVDGSDLNLPTDKNDSVYRIKHAASDNCYFQMHVNALYDICENRYISAVTQPRSKMNEPRAFCQMIDECPMPDNTIFIADRGYMTMNTLAQLIGHNKFFLIRAKSPSYSSSLLNPLMKENVESDSRLTIGITRSHKKLYMENPSAYKILDHRSVFDFIPPDDHESVYSMSIRCTCVELEPGSYEYLVSNLPDDLFSAEDLKQLYWKRWSVETSFRSLKYALSLAYLHSVNRELIIQEVFAKLIMYNFASLLHAYASAAKEALNRCAKTKYRYKVSFDDVVPIARELIKQPSEDEKIKALLLRHLTAVKMIKSSARRIKSQTVKPLNNRA